jgi:perosamine synthetase
MTYRIPYTKPSITELEVRYATDAAMNGWGENCYAYIDKFEGLFKNEIDVKYAIATSSCTGALHMGMAALGVGRGDEVILADTNWIATAAPIVHLGAKPVFVDILEDTWCIDPRLVEVAITPKTKAIIATHIYGNLCDMEALLEIGNRYSIPIIEDAAEALGSFYNGNHAGTMGRFGVFSFHGSKTLTTGEGGMFVSNDKDLYNQVLTLSAHGRVKEQDKQFWPEVVGFKYKISNIQAAIGCGQVERIKELIDKKRAILNEYRDAFSSLSFIKINPENLGTVNGSWMPTIVFDESTGITREKLQMAFRMENIDARVFFWPLSSLPMFNNNNQNTIATSIAGRAINLPSFHDIKSTDIKKICEVVKKLCNAL